MLLADRYEIVRPIGGGGMGEVFEALDRQTRRAVAIKRLRGERDRDGQIAARFAREIMATAQLTSRHVVALHDAGVDDDGEPFMVMDLLVGEDVGTLANRIGALPVELALRIASQACSGLVAAHAVGIVHRDIKPSNLFLVTATHTIKILDFGIARILHRADDVTELTRTGALIGSPLYMAPEQLRGAKELDHRADVWSLGVVLYRLLCGAVPHEATSIADLLIRVCSEPAPPLHERAPWVPPAVSSLVHRALEIDVAARLPSARAFADELHQLLPDGHEITAAMLAERAPRLESARGRAVAPSSVRPVASMTAAPPARPATRVRTGFLVALAAVAAAAVVAWRMPGSHDTRPRPAPAPRINADLDLSPEIADSAAGRWFAKVRTHCNAMELHATLTETPAPHGRYGPWFEAACAAIAGDLDLARSTLAGVPAHDRAMSVWPMFAVAHPLADRHEGDPAIAAIMRLVLDYWPDNYMALYHAGITEFMTGDARAADHLRAFRRLYTSNDGFGTTADAVLHELDTPSHDCSRPIATDPEGHAISACGPGR